MSPETTPFFNVFPEESGNIGETEQAFINQMQMLTDSGVMGPEYAGLRILVIKAARAVDNMSPRDAASGKSNLIRALNEVSQRLPKPKTSETSAIDRLEALFTRDTTEPGPYDAPPVRDDE